jgi:hypothetical protein
MTISRRTKTLDNLARPWFAVGASLLLSLTLIAEMRAQDFNYITNIGGVTITGYTGPGGDVTIPDTIIGLPVTSLPSGAFNGFNSDLMASVTIPNSVTNIGSLAFLYCPILTAINLDTNNPSFSSLDGVLFDKNQNTLIHYPYANQRKSYSIPKSVTNIATWAFNSSASLISVTISEGMTNIGDGAFDQCGLTSIAIPDSVVRLGDFAFENCNGLTNVTLGNNVTNIPDLEFAGCINLTSVITPNSVISIGDQSFWVCTSLANIALPNGVSTLGYEAFAGCSSLLSIALPDSVTSIGAEAFKSCSSLTNVTFSDSITNITGGAFGFCTSLSRIIIPNNVSSVGGSAFGSCPNLTGVYFEGNAPTFGGNVFYGNTNVTAYYLPASVGWGAWTTTSADRRPTGLWRPQIQVNRGFAEGPDQFGFVVNWARGITVAIDATTDLANLAWVPLQTNTLGTGSFFFTEPKWTNYSSRLYRIRSP